MSDLKNLLDREANRISAKPDALDGIRRRADRRHRVRQVTAGVTALAVVAAVALGGYTLLANEPDARTPGGNPTVGAEGWRGIWVHTSRSDAEWAQETADSGDPELQWQTDASRVASAYAQEEHRWTDVFFDDSLDGQSDVDRLELYVATCDVLVADACRQKSEREGRAQEEMLITMERLLRPGPGGIWSITAVHGPASFDRRVQPGWGRIPAGGGMDCPGAPVVPPSEAAVRAAAEDLLAAANAPQPDTRAVWDLLDPVTQEQFAPYELFAYHLRKAPLAPWDEWRVEYVGPDYPSDLEVAEQCGQIVREATVAAEVTFPNDPMAHVTLVFVGHPDGVRFWQTT